MKYSDFVVGNSTGWKVPGEEIVNKEIIVAKAGTKITCPKCGDLIGKLWSDLYSGARVKADQIDFAPHQKKHPAPAVGQPAKHQQAFCTKCGEPYMKHFTNGRSFSTRVHVEGLGWI